MTVKQWRLKQQRSQGKNKYSAKKVIYNGLKFDSKRELRMYQGLRAIKMNFEFQKKIWLFDTLHSKNVKIPLLATKGANRIKITVDFFFHYKGIDYYVDTKGVITETAALRFNILRHRLCEQGKLNSVILLPSTNKEVDALIYKIQAKQTKLF